MPHLLRHRDCELPAASPALGSVLMGALGEDAAGALLDAGYRGVLLGDAAVHDPGVAQRLVARYGGARVGVAVGAARLQVSWSLDTDSNPDFRIMRPTHAVPDWELVLESGARTGVSLAWWLGRMFERGISRAVVDVDVNDDADLNILAGLVDSFGDRLALVLTPAVVARFDDCVGLAGLRCFVADGSMRGRLPDALLAAADAGAGAHVA